MGLKQDTIKTLMLRKAVLIIGSTAIILGLALTLKTRQNTSSDLIEQASANEIIEYIKEQKKPLTLVNFWASWCEPCKVEFPSILEVKNRYAEKGLKVIFVSIDEPQDIKTAEEFLKEQKIDFKTFYKGEQPLSFVSQIYPKWSGAVPMTVLFDQQGLVLEAWEGDTSLEEFEVKVRNHLKGT